MLVHLNYFSVYKLIYRVVKNFEKKNLNLKNLKKMLTLLIALLASLTITVSADNWALLVAGSNEYYNYRHQVI